MNLTNVLVLVVLLPGIIHAQPAGRILGTVRDASTKQLLEGATISILSQETGIYMDHAISNKKGEFLVSGLPLNHQVQVFISFTGYKDSTASFILNSKNKIINSGVWNLQTGREQLDSVVFSGRKPPFIIKKDTLEFDATAFHSLPADMLQDLLRKIPGMAIDNEGRVTVNGKKVNRIKVDGRAFFSNNVQTAMENLPGSIIDKIQVTSTRERGEENNRFIKPITEEVTLNLTLKKQNSKGVFGHTLAGAGTLERHQAGVFLNAINGVKRYSVVGSAGNIATGMGNGMMGEGPGIVNSLANAGANSNFTIGKKGTLDAGYLGDNRRVSGTVILQQTNILPDSTFLYSNISQTVTASRNQRLNADYVQRIDSLQQFSVSASATVNNNIAESMNQASSTTTNGDLINTQKNNSISQEKTAGFNNRVAYWLTSKDQKTNFNINWNADLRKSNGNLSNVSQSIFYNNSTTPSDSLNQQSTTSAKGTSNALSVNLSRVLSKQFTAIVNYTLLHYEDNITRNTYNYDRVSGKYDQLDSVYSVNNHNTGSTHFPNISVGYNAGKLSLEMGAGMRWMRQQNRIGINNTGVIINQHNLSPRITAAYQFSSYAQWITNYMVNANAPTPDQLAPVPDNTNPLYIKIGNPYLRTNIMHNISTELRVWTPNYKWHAGFLGNSTISENQIVDDTYYDSLGRQVSSYRNTNGNRQVNLSLYGGKRIILNAWIINLDLSANVSYAHSNGYINLQTNRIVTGSVTPQFNMGIQFRQLLSVQATGTVNYNTAQYSLKDIEDINYNTKRWALMVRLMPVRRLLLNATAQYFYNSQLPDDFQKSRTLIYGAVSYSFLRSEKLTVGLAMNDILNNNINVTRTITPTSIQNTQVNALKRYGMLNISYRINTFADTKE